MDRRNFFTKCVAGGAVLLTGSLPQEWVPGCCAVEPQIIKHIPFAKLKMHIPPKYNWDKVAYVQISNSQYKVIRIDGRFYHCDSFSEGKPVTFKCGCIMSDFNEIYDLEERTLKIEKERGTTLFRYVVVNEKGKYGMLTNRNICFNFKSVKA